MFLRKKFESPVLVGLDPGHFQDNLGKTGDLWIVRLLHLSQTNQILFGDVRLFEKPEDIVLILDGSPLGLRFGPAPLTHVDPVTFARELLVRPLTPADPAVMPHTDPFMTTSPLDKSFGCADPTVDCDRTCTYPAPASTFAQYISFFLVIVIVT